MTIPVTFLGNAVFTISAMALWFYNCASWKKWQHLPKSFFEFFVLQALILLSASLMRLQFVILSLFTPFDLALLPCFGLFVWYAVQKSLFRSMFLYLNLFVPLIQNLYITTLHLLKNFLLHRVPLSQQQQVIDRSDQLFREAAKYANLDVDDSNDSESGSERNNQSSGSPTFMVRKNSWPPVNVNGLINQIDTELNRYLSHKNQDQVQDQVQVQDQGQNQDQGQGQDQDQDQTMSADVVDNVDNLIQNAIAKLARANQFLTQFLETSSACHQVTETAEEAVQKQEKLLNPTSDPLDFPTMVIGEPVTVKAQPVGNNTDVTVEDCDSLPDLIPNDDTEQ